MSTAANDATDGVPATAPHPDGSAHRSPSGSASSSSGRSPGRSSGRSLDDELAALEERVDRLAGLCTTLSLENRSLRGQQRTLVEERARLIEKNETARSKVEQMIVRLKSLEAGQ